MDVFAVEAFAASWIEIEKLTNLICYEAKSKPLRLRGLKLLNTLMENGYKLSKPLRLRGLKFF